MLGLAEAPARLRDKSAERNGPGQRVLAAVPDHCGLFHQQLQGRVVQHQVVARKLQQPAAMHRIVRGDGPHQRRLAHIDPEVAGTDMRAQPLCGIGAFQRRQPFERQRRLPQHHLHRGRQPLPQHRSAQDVMARYRAADRLDEAAKAGFRIEAHGAVHDVDIALRLQQVMEQNAFLQGAQRIDVLNVGGTALHRGRDAQDLLGIESDQVQHVGPDGLATRRNAGSVVARGICAGVIAGALQGRCKRLQPRGLEQRPYLRVPALGAHPLHQLDGQQ